MAYQNGTATSPTDLLQKLATFLLANGWTQDASATDGSGWRLHMHKGAVYINLRAAINESTASMFDGYYTYPWSGIALYVGTGYTSANNWKTQPGGPIANAATYTCGAGCPMGPGAISGYHFFTDATNDNVVVVMEKSAGIFGHFGWGTSVEKLGVWTGGPYFFASVDGYYMNYSYTTGGPGFAQMSTYPPGITRSQPCFFLRADVDAFTNKWIGFGDSTANYYGYTGKSGCSLLVWTGATSWLPTYSRIYERLTNQLNGQSLLLPIRLGVRRDAGGTSFVGNLPSIFQCNACAKGFTPATVYQWGTDNYMVFPGPSENPNCGFAVKKV